VRPAHVSLHIEVAREGLAADWADDAAGVLASVIRALSRRFDLLAAQPTFIHVPVNVQPVMFVEVPAADEPTAADFALEGTVTGVGATVDGQEVGADECPTAEIASEWLRDRRGAVERGEVRPHAALEGERLSTHWTRYPTTRTADGLCQAVLN